jgi:hypothetical protein
MSLITSFCLLLFDRRLESQLKHIQGPLCWKSSKLGKQFKGKPPRGRAKTKGVFSFRPGPCVGSRSQ